MGDGRDGLPLSIDPEKLDVTGLYTPGTVSVDSVSTDNIDAPELWEAFVAGFMQSGEGYNAEYPHSFDEEQVKESIRDDFERWFNSQADD